MQIGHSWVKTWWLTHGAVFSQRWLFAQHFNGEMCWFSASGISCCFLSDFATQQTFQFPTDPTKCTLSSSWIRRELKSQQIKSLLKRKGLPSSAISVPSVSSFASQPATWLLNWSNYECLQRLHQEMQRTDTVWMAGNKRERDEKQRQKSPKRLTRAREYGVDYIIVCMPTLAFMQHPYRQKHISIPANVCACACDLRVPLTTFLRMKLFCLLSFANTVVFICAPHCQRSLVSQDCLLPLEAQFCQCVSPTAHQPPSGFPINWPKLCMGRCGGFLCHLKSSDVYYEEDSPVHCWFHYFRSRSI